MMFQVSLDFLHTFGMFEKLTDQALHELACHQSGVVTVLD